MNLKKSIFSYIIWAAFAPLCCLCIVFALERAGITEMLGLPLYGIIGAVCVYLLLTAAVFFALHTIAAEIGRHVRDRKKAEAVLSVVLPVAVLVGVVVYLVLYLVYHTPLTLADDRFYRQALVSGGKSVPFAVHGASWLYTWLLHIMFLVFGNTPFAGVVLQIVLFFGCLLFLYIGMQAFAGTLPAAVSMALFGFLPVSIKYVFSLTPELFHLALYLLGFSLAGALYKKFRRQGIVSPVQYLPVFLTGIYIGFLAYLDIYGISLYLFLAVLFSTGREKTKQAAISGIVSLAGGICGFLLSVAAVCALEDISVLAYLQEFVSLYFSEVALEAELSRFLLFLPDITLSGSVLLVSLSFFIIPAFFLWKKGQCRAFIVNLFLVYGLAGISVFCLDMQMVVTFAWSILAGAGVYGVVRTAEEEMMEEAVTKEDNGDEKESGTSEEVEIGEEEKTGDLKMKTGKKAKKNVQSEKKKSSVKQSERISKDSEIPVKTSSENKKEQEKPAPGEPLHNPLPVPKRKIRPQVDFGYQVKETEMKFDLDVTDQDDFDW